MAPRGLSFKKYGLLGNIVSVKLVEKAGRNKPQNNEEGVTNNHVIETNNLGMFPNYCKDLSQNI